MLLVLIRWVYLLELSQPAEIISGVLQEGFESQIPARDVQSSELQLHSFWPKHYLITMLL